MKRFTIRWSMKRLRGSPEGEFSAEAEQFTQAYSMLLVELSNSYSPMILFAELETEVVSVVEVGASEELERLARRFWEVFHQENLKWMQQFPYYELFAKAAPYDDLGEGYQNALKAAVAAIRERTSP